MDDVMINETQEHLISQNYIIQQLIQQMCESDSLSEYLIPAGKSCNESSLKHEFSQSRVTSDGCENMYNFTIRYINVPRTLVPCRSVSIQFSSMSYELIFLQCISFRVTICINDNMALILWR